jgi:hypothetical protein
MTRGELEEDEALEVVEERGLAARHELAQVVELARREAEALHEAQHFLEPCKDGEFTGKRILAKEHVEHGMLVVSSAAPVCIHHSKLVHVCQQRRTVGRARVKRARGGSVAKGK